MPTRNSDAPSESFSSVVRRAVFPDQPCTASELLAVMEERLGRGDALLDEAALDRLDAAQAAPRVSDRRRQPVLFDTTFIIDLQREALRRSRSRSRSRSRGRAHAFLEAHAEVLMRISIVACAELAEGFAPDAQAAFLELVRPYEVIGLSREAGWHYGGLSRRAREEGARIGDNDLWIAATALAADVPPVRRDAERLSRVPGLRVVAY